MFIIVKNSNSMKLIGMRIGIEVKAKMKIEQESAAVNKIKVEVGREYEYLKRCE